MSEKTADVRAVPWALCSRGSEPSHRTLAASGSLYRTGEKSKLALWRLKEVMAEGEVGFGGKAACRAMEDNPPAALGTRHNPGDSRNKINLPLPGPSR